VTALSVNTYDAMTGMSLGSVSTAPYGSLFYLEAQPYGQASTTSNGNVLPDGIATGSVTFMQGSSVFTTTIIGAQGIAAYNNNAILRDLIVFCALFRRCQPSIQAPARACHCHHQRPNLCECGSGPPSVDASAGTTLSPVRYTDSRGILPQEL